MRWLLAPLALTTLSPAAGAQALLKPHGESAAPLILKTLHADVKITGPVATTTLTLRYANPHSQRIEADFLYQLPEGAVATAFAYWYGDEKVPARIAERERAAAIYKAITTRQRDPALVELVGKNKLRARIFPVEPNADLRIELVYVSALPRDRDGSALFTLPLALDKEAPHLDACTANVSVIGWPTLQNNLGLTFTEGALTYSISHIRPNKNLRVRLRGIADSLLAAPSGGRDGFFALTSLQKNAASPAHSYAVHRQALGAGWLVTGRYRQATQEPEPNGPAAKLWAAQELTALGKGSRRQAVALSMRHGIVCAHTSWIAIPVAERERYETEKREAEIQVATDALADAIRHRRPTQALRARLASRCQGTKHTPQELLLAAFRDELYSLADQAAHGDSTAKRKLEAQAQRIGTDPLPLIREARAPLVQQKLDEALKQLATLFHSNRDSSNRARTLVTHIRTLSDEISNQDALQNFRPQAVEQASQRLARAQLDSLPPSSVDHALVQRLARLTGISEEHYIETEMQPLVVERIRHLQEEVGRHLQSFEPDRLPDLNTKLAVAKEALTPLLNRLPIEPGAVRTTPEKVVQEQARYQLREVTEAYVKELTGNRPEGAPPIQPRVRHLAQLAELPAPVTETYAYQTLLNYLSLEQRRPRLDRQRIATLEKQLRQVEEPTGTTRPPLPTFMYDNDEALRSQLLAERRKLPPNPERLRALAQQLEQLTAREKGRDYAKLRVELLLTDTELDTLENQPAPDPRALAALQKRSKTLHARFGDPLLTIDAPQNTQLVVAQFADGSVKPLAWSPERQRWELRFDVPPHARPGAWDIQITIVHADGHREARVFPVTVDMDAPQATGSLTRLPDGRVRLEVRATPDSRRATAFFAGAEPVELTPTGQPGGFFTLLDALPQNLKVVVTDRAHNRTELTEFAKK